MAKSTRGAKAAPASALPVDSDRRLYQVAHGVDLVNGVKLNGRREVLLSAAEARYDLAHGRIVLKVDDGGH